MATRQQGGTGHQDGYSVVSGRSREPSEHGGDSPDKHSIRHFKSSSKVRELTDEIKELENRALWLEGRNDMLSKRLMKMQATTVSKGMNVGPRQLKQRVFKAWVAVGGEIRLERHLEEQTKALDQCKQVATELGMALKHEQEVRMEEEDSAHHLQEELVGASTSNDSVRRKIESQVGKKAMLEKRLATVEKHVDIKRGHARAVVGEGDRYESRKRDLDREQRPQPQQQQLYSLEDSQQLRGEARETMQQVRELLPPPPRVASPPRSPLHTSPPRSPPRLLVQPPTVFTYAAPPTQTSPQQRQSRADQALNRLQDFHQRYPARTPQWGPSHEVDDELLDEFERAQRDSREELVRAAAMQQPQLALPAPQRRLANDRLGAWQHSDGMDGHHSPMYGNPVPIHHGGIGTVSMPYPSHTAPVGHMPQQRPLMMTSAPVYAGAPAPAPMHSRDVMVVQPGSPQYRSQNRIYQDPTQPIGYAPAQEQWWSRGGQPTRPMTHTM